MVGKTSELGLNLQKMMKEIRKPAKTEGVSTEHAENQWDSIRRDRQKSAEKSTKYGGTLCVEQ